jgi:hypothetical protein
MPEQYEKWTDAQMFSEKAANDYANYKDIIYPLEKTKQPHVLENMWKYVNIVSTLFDATCLTVLMKSKNYKAASGMDIDTLWQLEDVLQRAPQWHAFYIPGAGKDADSDLDGPSNTRDKKTPRKKRLAISNRPANEDDSDGSMPGLQTASSSGEDSDDGFFDSDDNDNDDDDDEDSGYESEYDEEFEDEMREMRREAMDIAATIPEFFDPAKPLPDEFKNLEEERKGNPFLKLLGSLRG